MAAMKKSDGVGIVSMAPALNAPFWGAASVAVFLLSVLVAVGLNSLNAFLLILGIALLPIVGVLNPAMIVATFLFLNLLIPKVPLIEIPGYLVPIRIEDVFLACALLCLLLRYIIFREKPAPNPLIGWMVLFSVLTGLSFLFGLFVLHSVPGAKVGFLFWLRGPEYFAAAYLCLLGVTNWKRYRQVMVAFVVFVALTGVYGILQEFSLVPIFDAMHINDEIVTIRFFPGFGQDRLFSTFAGPPDFAAFYLIAIPILVALLLVLDSKVTRIVLAGVLALSLFCFYLTYARGPLAALVVALAVCFWLLGKRLWGVVLGPICFLPALLFGGFVERIDWAREDMFGDMSVGLRVTGGWAQALSAAARSPLLGTGPASLTTSGPGSHTLEGVGVDGLYFLLIGMWGICGALCFLIMIAKGLRHQWTWVHSSTSKMQRALAIGLFAGGVGLLVNGLVVDSFFMSKIAFSYWFLMGLLFAGNALEKSNALEKNEAA
jgi:hypothetical protein